MKEKEMSEKLQFNAFSGDIKAGLVVFLVALPLCLGIALASGAPLFSGIIAGVVGGIVVGAVSGSALSVSGPAAGLTVIVATSIASLHSFEVFLLAIVIAGVFQIILGLLKAGVIGDFVPSTVIKGMLAAIGLILILKQFPHLIGYDADFEGDESFIQPDGENTFTEIAHVFRFIQPAAVLIGIVSLLIQILWERKWIKENKMLSIIPSPLLVVIIGMAIAYYLEIAHSPIALEKEFFVSLPIADSFTAFQSFFSFPSLTAIGDFHVWKIALTIAIVASLETLLSIEASDKLDEYKRVTPTNRELIAQGTGNIVSGLLGGLPVTAVIVRSAANANAGGKSKVSAIFHGVLLIGAVVFFPGLMNRIPLPALAGILIFVGFKLAKPVIFLEAYRKGLDQFIPFVVTIVAILLSDLLVGILIGIACSLFFILRSSYRTAILFVQDESHYLIKFRNEVSFLNKSYLRNKLEEIPANSNLLIDASKTDYVDKDIVEIVNDFIHHAQLKNIKVEIKADNRHETPMFKNITV